MEAEDFMVEEVSDTFCSGFCGSWKAVDHFGVVVDKGDYGIVPVLCHREFSNKINSNVLPGAIRNREWL